MVDDPFTIEETPQGLRFKIRVQPRASRNRVAGRYGDALKVQLTAPPVDNAANQACRAFLAEGLGVTRSAVTIVSGHTGRAKQILVACPPGSADRQALRRKILAWASAS